MPKKHKFNARFNRKRNAMKRRKIRSNYPNWKNRVTFKNSALMKGPMPPRFRTKFYLDFSVYVAAAAYAATTEKTMIIKHNSVHLPLANIAAPFTFNPGSSGLTVVALQPVGLSQLLAPSGTKGIYSSFRVYASKCSVLCIPQALGDSMIVSIVGVPPNSGVVLDIQSAQEVPYSRTKVCNSGGNPMANKISNYVSTADLCGLTRAAIEDDVSSSFEGTNAADPTQLTSWRIVTQTADNAGNTGVVTFQVKLTYYVELFESKMEDLTFT